MINGMYTRISLLASSRQIHLIGVMGFALAIGILSWMALPNGGIDMNADILPSLGNWRAPWEEGTPLFPWATLILMPLRLLTPRDATALINGFSVVIIAFLIRRFDGNIWFTVPIVLSPIGYRLLTTGQTDAIVLAGVFLPAGLDLLLFWKPQVLAHIFWVRGMAQPKVYLIAGAVLFVFSLLVWGWWPKIIMEFGRTQLMDGWWNFSLWPYSIPPGLLMIYLSIREKDIGYGIIASPLLFPYVNGPSYIGLLAVVAAKWPRTFMVGSTIIIIYLLAAHLVPELNLPNLY
jgi:hypothetical protein